MRSKDRRPVVEIEEGEENLGPGEEMQVDRGREQPDPEELREASADAAGGRPTMMGGATAQNYGEKTGASRRETRETARRRRR